MDCHQNGHFGGFEAHRVGTEPLCRVTSVLGGGFSAGAPTGVGMLLAQGTGWFWGPVVYYAAISMSQYWWGNPSFPKV